MKGRKWVLVLFFLSTLIIGGYLAAFKLFEINRRARLYVIEHVSEAIGSDFEAESVYVLPWAFGIRDASLTLADSPVRIDVTRIRIEFDFLSFLLNNFKPVAGTRQIFIDQPRFTWLRDTASLPGGEFHSGSVPVFAVRDLPATDLIVTDGSFLVSRGDSSLVVADHINGLVSGRKPTRITVSVEGCVLSDAMNTSLSGELDRDTDSVIMDLTVDDADFSRNNLSIITGDIDPRAGMLGMSLHFERIEDEIKLTGNYGITSAAFGIRGSRVSVTDASLSGAIEENRIDFDSAVGTLFGVTPHLKGRLHLTPTPAISLTASADSADIAGILPVIFPGRDQYPGGVVSFTSTIVGNVEKLAVGMHVEADSVWYGNEALRGLRADISLDNGITTLDHISATYKGYTLTGNGVSERLLAERSSGGAKDIAFNLEIDGIDDTAWRYNLSADGQIDPEGYDTAVRLDMDRFGEDGAYHLFDTVEGELSYRDTRLSFDIATDTITLNGSAGNLASVTAFDIDVAVNSLNPVQYLGLGDGGPTIDGSGHLSGNLDSLAVVGEYRIVWGKNINSLLTGEVAVSDPLGNARHIVYTGALSDHHLRYSHPLFWRLGLDSDMERTTVQVDDEAGAALQVAVDHATGGLSGTLALDELPLEWIIDIFRREEFGERGLLTGSATVGGTISDPSFATAEPVQVTELKVGGLNRLTGECRVSGKLSEMHFTDATIQRKGIDVLEGDGHWYKGNPFIVEAAAHETDLAAIGDIISDNRRIDGTVNYNATLTFTRKWGTIEGKYEILHGHFLDVPFDYASGKLGGGSEGFLASDFVIRRDGVYTGEGQATSGYFWKDSTAAPGLLMNIMLQGDLMLALPHLTGAIDEATGQSQLLLTLGGYWQDPVVFDGELYVNGGTIRPSFLVDEISDINAVLDINPELSTISGLRGVRVRSGSGVMNGRKLVVQNYHPQDEIGGRLASERPELMSIVNGTTGLDFGILGAMIENGKREPVFSLHIPGIMRPKETGTFLLAGDYNKQFLVGAADAGDHLVPFLSGDVIIMTGDVTFPFLEVDGEGDGGDVVEDLMWDLTVRAGSNVNYERETNFAIGSLAGTTVSRTVARIDENSSLAIRGRVNDGTLAVTGSLRSMSGSVEYYGTDFDIERAEMEVDTANTVRPASLSARARTVAFDDSTGIETEIYLNVYSVDRNSGRRQQVPGRVEVRDEQYELYQARLIDMGMLGMLEIEFTSTNPSDDTQEKILARLGLSPGKFGDAAARAFAAGVDNFYFNPILRPFEDVLRKYTRLDVVRFTPSVLGNIMRSQIYGYDSFGPENESVLFEQSRVMLGEYVLDDWFLSYRGQYGVGRDYLSRKERGFYHEVGLQYLLQHNTRVMINYNYDDIISKSDRRFEIRHDFEF